MSFAKPRSVTITTCLRRQARYISSSQPTTSTYAPQPPTPGISSSPVRNPQTRTPKSTPNVPVDAANASSSAPTKPTHFKITLHRSAIGLPKRYKETLESLGIRKRGQTVFHAHSGASAGKILRVKELVKVENVTAEEVQTKAEIRNERKAVRGYVVKQRFNGASTTWMNDL